MHIIVIEGKPIPKKRPRFVRRGKFVSTYNPQIAEEDAVKIIAKPQTTLLEGALNAILIFYMPIPKSTSKKKRALMVSGETPHTKKPDVDNMIKFYLDVLNGMAYKDDSQVVHITASKVYSEYPRTEITID